MPCWQGEEELTLATNAAMILKALQALHTPSRWERGGVEGERGSPIGANLRYVFKAILLMRHCPPEAPTQDAAPPARRVRRFLDARDDAGGYTESGVSGGGRPEAGPATTDAG